MSNINKNDVEGYLDLVALEINTLRVSDVKLHHILSTLELGDFSRYRFTYIHFMVRLVLWWLRRGVEYSGVNNPCISLYVQNACVDGALDGKRDNKQTLDTPDSCLIYYTRDDFTRLTKLITPEVASQLVYWYNKRYDDLDSGVSEKFENDIHYLKSWAMLRGDMNHSITLLRGYVAVRNTEEWRVLWGW